VRPWLVILAVLAVLGALATVKGAQFHALATYGCEAVQRGPPPESVGAAVAARQGWETTLDAVGTVTSDRGVVVTNEVPGVVTRIAFESGARVAEGQPIVELDANVERAELASALAEENLARVNADRARALVEARAVPPALLDEARAQLGSAAAKAAARGAQLDKRVVRAPFAGRLGIREVNLGQYLAHGTPITMLETTDTVFVDFTLPQQRLADVTPGAPVRIEVAGGRSEPIEGAVDAIDATVDPKTRAVAIRARIENPSGALRAGMFVDVALICRSAPTSSPSRRPPSCTRRTATRCS
jgi:membrane fusion protein (multidrug efflux system)